MCLNSKKTSSKSFKEFLGNKNKFNKKRFLGEASGHNDHYMINIGSQRLKIGSYWLLTGPYLQRWSTHCWQNFKTSVERKLSSVIKYLWFSLEFPEFEENTI